MTESSDPLESARAALDAGAPAEADRLAEAELRRHRSSVDALEIRAAAAYRMARHEAARVFLQRCITARPREPRYYARLAEVLTAEGRYDDALTAIARMRKACGAGVPVAVVAMLHRLRGDRAEAARLIAAEIRAGRQGPDVELERAEIALAEGQWSTAEAAADRAARDGTGSIARRAAFALGAARERLGAYAGAFEAWTQANALADHAFDAAAFDQRVERILTTYAADRLSSLARAPAPARAERAVLIVGLPRSGTSLVEQVLASHSGVAGAAELADLTRLARELRGPDGTTFPEAAAGMDARAAARLGRAYLDGLRRVSPRAAVVTNKNLDHHELLGLVWQVLPGARIIVVERDRRDTALSCFASNLQPGNQPWASAVDSIAHAFAAHARLMDHWRRVLDLPMATVSYEALVTDPEPQVRALLQFLDLPFEDACLRHHESARTVPTLSVQQVRRPLYTHAIGRWCHYASAAPELARITPS